MKTLLFENPGAVGPAELEADLAALPAWRREKALSFRFNIDRVLSAKAYLLLQQALREGYGIIEPPEFAFRQNGKPFLRDHPSIHFNLSHCRSGVLCVVDDSEVGCDIEEVMFDSGLCGECFCPQEQSRILSAPVPALEFTRLWTRKEAALKLTGEGIAACGGAAPGLKYLFERPEYAALRIETFADPLGRFVWSVAHLI